MNRATSIETTDDLWNAIVEAGLADRHLALMNFNWWPDSPWDVLTPYAKIASNVAGRPEVIRPLIENPNWRFNLFGVAIAILADAKPVLDSMVARMDRSWAAPQIGAGVAILLSGTSEDVRDSHLQKMLAIAMSPASDHELKFVMSAYSSVRIVSRPHVASFENDTAFREKWRAGASWYDMTRRHYERWGTVLPYLAKYVDQAANPV